MTSCNLRYQKLLLSGICSVLVSFICCSSANADEPVPLATFLQRFNPLRTQNPALAVKEARQYLHDNVLPPGQCCLLYQTVSTLQSRNLHDTPAALVSLDEGIQKLAEQDERFPLILSKAKLLLAAGRNAEAAKMLREQWPAISGARQELAMLSAYAQALRASGQQEVALTLTRQVMTDWLEWLDYQNDLFGVLIDQLVATNKLEEAESWAKLDFVLCPYAETSLRTAMQLLVKVWTAKYNSPAKVAELSFALAASSSTPLTPGVVNPLQSVPLPTLPEAALRTRLSGKLPPGQRVVLLLALHDSQQAMVEARRLMLDQPASTDGVLNVCRVFKACDMNVLRANSFLTYYKSGQGENPVVGFLQEK